MNKKISKIKLKQKFNPTDFVANLILNSTDPIAYLQYVIMQKLTKNQILELY